MTSSLTWIVAPGPSRTAGEKRRWCRMYVCFVLAPTPLPDWLGTVIACLVIRPRASRCCVWVGLSAWCQFHRVGAEGRQLQTAASTHACTQRGGASCMTTAHTATLHRCQQHCTVANNTAPLRCRAHLCDVVEVAVGDGQVVCEVGLHHAGGARRRRALHHSDLTQCIVGSVGSVGSVCSCFSVHLVQLVQ